MTKRYPPCRRLRSRHGVARGDDVGYPPCRRLRSQPLGLRDYANCYPPCRRLRSTGMGTRLAPASYPPCRRLRSERGLRSSAKGSYPPCRRLRSHKFLEQGQFFGHASSKCTRGIKISALSPRSSRSIAISAFEGHLLPVSSSEVRPRLFRYFASSD